MPNDSPTAPAAAPVRPSLFGYNALFIGLRYLLRKKLCYLAIVGIALSVGTLIVVMSVFTGFQLKLTGVIRGYLSDLTIKPLAAGLQNHNMHDWQLFRQKVLEEAHVAGVAPFIESVGLMRLPATDYMSYVFFRGVDPKLEPTVSEIGHYMSVGDVSDLSKLYRNPEGGELRACFVGKEFPGFSADNLRLGAGQLILVTATRDLDRRLRKFAVNGMFETGNVEYDSQWLIMNIEAASDLVASSGGVTGLSVKLDSYENAETVRSGLRDRVAWGAELRVFGGAGPAERVALSNNGSRAAVLTQAGEVIMWAATTKEPVLRLAPSSPKPTILALDHAGERLLTGFEDGSAAIRRLGAGGNTFTVTSTNGAVTAAAFSPSDATFAVGHQGGAVEVFDAEKGQSIRRLSGQKGSINAVAFDSAGEKLLTASADGTGRIWDTAAGALLARLVSPSTAPGAGGPSNGPSSAIPPLTCCAFSRDGRRAATGDEQGRIVVWDAATGKAVFGWTTDGEGVEPAGNASVLGIAFGEETGSVVTAGKSGISLWSYQVGGGLREAVRRSAIPAEGAPVKSAAFKPDGTRLLAATGDGRVGLYYGGAGFHVMTWEEQRKTFVEAIGMERFLMALILSLILIVAEFLIFAIVTTMVSERRRDIGILKAVGFTNGQICLVFLVVGLAIGVIGALSGVGAGLLFADHINVIRDIVRDRIHFDPFPPDIYYFKQIPAQVTAVSVVATAGGAIVCSLLFSILPALRAARMDPVQTLHYE